MTLQELADSLAVSAESARQRAQQAVDPNLTTGYSASYEVGYANALLDTRATVLALIEDVNRRIRDNNRVVSDPRHHVRSGDAATQALLDGRVEAYEDVRGQTAHGVESTQGVD